MYQTIQGGFKGCKGEAHRAQRHQGAQGFQGFGAMASLGSERDKFVAGDGEVGDRSGAGFPRGFNLRNPVASAS